MTKTPSKYLSRAFLRELLDNRCISRGEIEYSEEEVRDLLNEKDCELSLSDYTKAIQDYETELAALELGIVKGLQNSQSSNNAPILFCANTVFPLKELPSQCFNDFAPKKQQQYGAMQIAPFYKGKTMQSKSAKLEKSFKNKGRWQVIDTDKGLELCKLWMQEIDEERTKLQRDIAKYEQAK